MLLLKQSTAVTVKIGPFVDDTDGKTAENSLSLTQADIRLSMNGGNIAQKTEATAPGNADELGYYDVMLDATDTGTLGRLQLMVHKAGALPVYHEFQVITALAWNNLCATATWDVNVVAMAANTVTASALQTDAVTEITDAILAKAVEGTITIKQALAILIALASGKITGGGTPNPIFSNRAETVSRITHTVADEHGNRATAALSFTDL